MYKINLTIIWFVLYQSSCLKAQDFEFPSGCWMPKHFLMDVKSSKFTQNNESFQVPVTYIWVQDGNVAVQLYKQELTRVNLTKAGKDRFQIGGLPGPSNDVILKYSDSKYYLSVVNDLLLLEVNTRTGVDSIFFMNSIDGYKLDHPWITNIKFALIEKTAIVELTSGRKYLDVNFKLNNSILNWQQYTQYSIVKTNILDANDASAHYWIISLTTNDGSSIKYAAKRDKENNDIILSSYSDSKKLFSINIEKNVFVLKNK